MYDLLGPGTILGYCTNVHPGATLEELKHSLDIHATRVREIVCPDQELPIGLWFSAAAVNELSCSRDMSGILGDWLKSKRVKVYTVNAFPYGDFQSGIVKHAVYQPDWRSEERTGFTMKLCFALASGILDADTEGSISTLPLGWGADLIDPDARLVAAVAVATLADCLTAFEAPSVHLDLEPEPGCALQCADDVVRLFADVFKEQTAITGIETRNALRVCHDICHSAVMFEDQLTALRTYADNAIRVGKVQISSALRVRFDALSPADRREAKRQLLPFAEDRYLHQTMIRDDAGGLTFHEDLHLALAAAGDEPRGEWRIHYHVPIFLDRIGLLETTNDEIPGAIRAARELHDVKHFEVETYAWPVLPRGVWSATIEEGIAKELLWVKENAPRWLAPTNPA